MISITKTALTSKWKLRRSKPPRWFSNNYSSSPATNQSSKAHRGIDAKAGKKRNGPLPAIGSRSLCVSRSTHGRLEKWLVDCWIFRQVRCRAHLLTVAHLSSRVPIASGNGSASPTLCPHSFEHPGVLIQGWPVLFGVSLANWFGRHRKVRGISGLDCGTAHRHTTRGIRA